jgi:hypothetical protein
VFAAHIVRIRAVFAKRILIPLPSVR